MSPLPPTDLTAKILSKAGQALLVEAKQREDLEKPLDLCQVHRCHSFIQLVRDDDLQFFLGLLQQ